MLAIDHFAFQNLDGQRVGNAMLDHPFERAGAKGGIIAFLDDQIFGLFGQRKGDVAALEQLAQAAQLDFDNRLQLLLVQRMEGGGNPTRTLLGGDALFVTNALLYVGALLVVLFHGRV